MVATNPYAKFGAERCSVIQCLIDEWEHEDSPEYAEQVFATPFVMRKAISPECPYSFPARTLGDVIDFLARDRSRQYAYHRETGSRLAWYVKAHNIDVHGKESEYERNAALDDAWEKHLETRKGLPACPRSRAHSSTLSSPFMLSVQARKGAASPVTESRAAR